MALIHLYGLWKSSKIIAVARILIFLFPSKIEGKMGIIHTYKVM